MIIMIKSKQQDVFHIPYMIKHFMYQAWETSYPKNPHPFIPKQLLADCQRVSKQGIFLHQLFHRQAAIYGYKETINYFIIYLKR